MIWNEYIIKIRSIPDLNEFALAEICEYIELNYGYDRKDIRARVINIPKKTKRYLAKLKKYKEELKQL